MAMQNMKRGQEITVVRKDNVFYILRGEDSTVSDWQHRSSFATEARPVQNMVKGYEEKVREYAKEGNYIKAARIAERCNDNTLKMRTCMDGIRHYDDMLRKITSNKSLERRMMLEDISAVHSVMSELYEIFGDKRKADAHLDLSIMAENGMLSDY
jgi:hypothetical protein